MSAAGPYQKRTLILELCAGIADKYKKWQGYDASGTLASAGSGCTDSALSDSVCTEATADSSYSLKVSIISILIILGFLY